MAMIRPISYSAAHAERVSSYPDVHHPWKQTATATTMLDTQFISLRLES